MYVVQGKNILDQRVEVSPSPAMRGQNTTIRYNGLLAKSGASQMYIHYGYDNWKNTQTKDMQRDPDGSFVTTLPVQGTNIINFCFKDSANNWDNNSGWNWSTDIR
ncbi:carbohydrate-binding protein [Desulfolucanica intricata]|uniref:carbohydrate-binding protein n=1 Tax=Desulfolucanica intricata TaxID=1285191 RepID=UPI000830980D|nr:carbohydrate-binding protein [Desulfolucanica intricata]